MPIIDCFYYVLSGLYYFTEVKVYREMVKILMIGSDGERSKQLSKLEKDLEKQQLRFMKLQDLYIEGGLSREDYNSMRNRYSAEKTLTENKLNEIRNTKTGFKKSLEKGVGILSDIGRIYKNADLNDKRRIISSIFPENLVFDGEKCRTPRINDVLRLILLIDKRDPQNKSGQIFEFLDVSAQVEIRGIEPLTL